jgi:hypothetical protein
MKRANLTKRRIIEKKIPSNFYARKKKLNKKYG